MLPAAVLATVLACSPAAGQGDDIHIPAKRSVSLPWNVTDGAGFLWDIYHSGQVNNGSDDAYDGGMQLSVSSSQFSSASAGRISEDGREIELGPAVMPSLRVHRRIYVDAKLSYCRWIDIFHNPGSSNVKAPLRYYSNMGGTSQFTHTTSGRSDLAAGDWGIVTADSAQSSRPAVVHVFATAHAKVRPQFQFSRNNDNLYYNLTLEVPAGRTVALCFFEAQRRPYAEAKKFLKEFQLERELAKIPPALRRLIVNMGSFMWEIGGMSLPRSDQHDLATLRNGDELLGTILQDKFELRTFAGSLDLPPSRVVGLSVPAPDDPHVLVALADGQVIGGELLNAPLKLRLVNGSELSLPPSQVKTLAYRVQPGQAEPAPAGSAVAVLRSGERLFFQGVQEYDFHTEYGDLKLLPDHLQAICLETPGGLHRAVFHNGSVLSGLLAADGWKLRLDLGPAPTVPVHVIEQFQFRPPGAPASDLAEMVLRNDDAIRGSLAERPLTVETRFGPAVVSPAEIAAMELAPGSADAVQIKLHNGSTVSGRMAGKTVGFRIEPGPELSIFVGHIRNLTCPKPSDPGQAATSAPTAAAPLTPEAEARIADMKAELANLAAMEAKVLKMMEQTPNVSAAGQRQLGLLRERIRNLTEAMESTRQGR